MSLLSLLKISTLSQLTRALSSNATIGRKRPRNSSLIRQGAINYSLIGVHSAETRSYWKHVRDEVRAQG